MIRFPDYIRRHAFQTPDKIATHFEGRDFTWQNFHDRIHAMAQALSDLGVQPGERVAFLGQNSHWMIEMYFAPCIIGAIMVPVNYRLSLDEHVQLLEDCTPRVLVVDRHFQDRAAALMARCSSLGTLIFADWDAPDACLPDDALRYDALVDRAPPPVPDAFDQRGSASDETMLLFYTSGTTGRPKGVMLSHSNLLANAMGTGPLYDYSHKDVVLFSGPMFHLATGGRVYTSVLYGTTMIIQSKFEVVGMMELVQDQHVTTATFVPTMMQMILDHPRFADFDFSSVRCLTYGSAPMPVALMKRLMAAIPGVVFSQAYGMTEASPVITMMTPEDHRTDDEDLSRLASVGKPVPYCDIRIFDEDDNPVPQGQTGEVVVRGPQIMHGYWQRPEETERALRGGFYHTGDAGYFDDDGYLFLVGRKKEMVISGGENIYPIETENCLAKHPAVANSAVLGLPHPKWGEMLFAAVSLKPGHKITEDELIAFCRSRIAGYKVPKSILIWDGPLPLNPANKIDKLTIRRQVLEARDA